VGKTTSARILAKALNCMGPADDPKHGVDFGPTITPCLQCPACLEIAQGTDMDVREIDGASYNGVGDLVAHGQAALLVTHDAQAGAMLSASWPTGAETFGLGMGHPMLMPAVWGTWRLDRVELSGSAGYSWAVASGGHVHGMQPLVEPMNMSELTWGAAADVAVGGGVRLGTRVAGGVPIVQAGDDRMIGAVHAAWGVHRIDTAAELQVGLLGDPFNIRAVLSTALRF